jgi:hypothetical protein
LTKEPLDPKPGCRDFAAPFSAFLLTLPRPPLFKSVNRRELLLGKSLLNDNKSFYPKFEKTSSEVEIDVTNLKATFLSHLDVKVL